MQIGIVGLGRMGGNMARRLARGGVGVTGFDPDAATRDALAQEGAIGAAASLDALVAALPAPRVVWLMVPAGEPTTRALGELAGDSRRAISSSTAATPTTRIRSGAPRNSPRAGCCSPTAASAAASGASTTAMR